MFLQITLKVTIVVRRATNTMAVVLLKRGTLGIVPFVQEPREKKEKTHKRSKPKRAAGEQIKFLNARTSFR